MSATCDLKARLTEMGVVPKKAFGQNFLVSQHVIGKIIEAVRSRTFKGMVEVGPGLGALTEPLLKVDLHPQVIELDRDLAAYWQSRGLRVHEADALKFDWNTLQLQEPALLVSNLPYQISTSLVIDRCLGPLAIKYMVLMFQKEVAQRLTASPSSKEYGMLSVMAQLHFRIARVADASPGDFFPAPKIASRVLLFERIEAQGLGVPFLKFAKHAFQFRRKFLLKNLKSVMDKAKLETLTAGLTSMGLNEKARAEELSPAQFRELFKKVYEH